MLDYMRRNAQSWGIKIALGIICVVFVFFMGGGASLTGGAGNLATVGDVDITVPQFQQTRMRIEAVVREQYGGNIPAELLRALDLNNQAISQLVDQAVLVQEANNLGLEIPDEAVKDSIRDIDAFHVDGQFSPTGYRNLLRAQGLSPGGFEEEIRREMLTNQIADIVRRGVVVSEDEAFENYLAESRKVALSYVVVSRDDFTDDVTIDEAGLESFFEDNAEDFRQGETVRVRYLAYRTDDWASKVEVGEEAIEEHYELNKEDYTTEEQVGARHILIKVDEDADDETKAAARARIDALAKRIADGEDFATLAGEHSEDAGSAVKDGDLGVFGRGRMVEPFENAAFALDVGAVSDVVESRFGYHIIKVYERVEAGTKTIDEVRDDIVAELAKVDAKDAVFDAASADAADIADGAKMDTIAEERGLSIEETALFGKGDTVPGIGPAPALVDAALELTQTGQVTDAVKVGDDYYVLELTERRESRIPDLDEVREDVEAAYRKELATEAARARADELLAEIRGGKSLADIAKDHELDVADTEPFGTRGKFVPGIGNVEGLKDVAFRAKADGDVLPRPFVHRGDAYVLVRKSAEEGDRKGFDEARDDHLERLRVQKEQIALAEFLRELKSRTEIRFDQNVLAQVTGGAQ